MSRNSAYRLSGELELQALQQRIGYRGSEVTPSPQAQYGKRGEMVDLRPLERDVLRACLDALKLHKKVWLVWRANSGGFTDVRGQYVKMNFEGCSDLLFMLKGGRMGACEVKRPGEKPTTAQQNFLENVRAGGGLAFCAHSVDEVSAALENV